MCVCMRLCLYVCVHALLGAGLCVRGQLFSSAAGLPASDCFSLQNPGPPGFQPWSRNSCIETPSSGASNSLSLCSKARSRGLGSSAGRRALERREVPVSAPATSAGLAREGRRPLGPGGRRQVRPSAPAAPQRTPSQPSSAAGIHPPSSWRGPQAPLLCYPPPGSAGHQRGRSSRPPPPRTTAATKARGAPSRPPGAPGASAPVLPPWSALSRPPTGRRGGGPRGLASWPPRSNTAVGQVPRRQSARGESPASLSRPAGLPRGLGLEAATGLGTGSRRPARPGSKGTAAFRSDLGAPRPPAPGAGPRARRPRGHTWPPRQAHPLPRNPGERGQKGKREGNFHMGPAGLE